MQKLKFEFVKPFQTRGCWTRAFELFLVCFFLFSFLSHVAYEKDLFEGICCFGEKALKKDSEPLFCFPDHPIDYEGSFFLNKKQKGNNPYGKVAAVHGFLLSFQRLISL